ncbi:hypothetical protein SAE02_31940 [Skermanella aerolata]|uniref:Uncharacterized protein n=1 Tax=Skermanella aerolata TaxID=393310 RepID=A0A512DRK0_9PROT|nr:hypothetical protein SAE02_31940 [Skermanella aerolata]
MLVPVNVAGHASKIPFERIELATQFRIDFSLIKLAGKGFPHQHPERRKPVSRRSTRHRTQRPVVGQRQVKTDIDLIGIGLQP